jgi:hypothetical protein
MQVAFTDLRETLRTDTQTAIDELKAEITALRKETGKGARD